jgi:ABC-type amino acid transport substrate-binding protein
MIRRVACLLAFALVAAHGSGADLADIQKRGVLKVIAQKGEAPEMFRFSGSGEPGFEREMLQGFAALYDLSLEPVPVGTSADRIPALLRGDGDVIIGIVDNPKRREQIAFTPEVLPARHLVVTCAPGPRVQGIEEFRRAKVGVVDATSWKDEAVGAGVPVSEMTLFPTREPVFEALEAGRITATVMTTTDFLLAARSHPCLEGGVGLGAAGSAGWGLRKDSPDLQAALDAYISNYRAGPSWNRLIVKYFGDQALRALGRE